MVDKMMIKRLLAILALGFGFQGFVSATQRAATALTFAQIEQAEEWVKEYERE